MISYQKRRDLKKSFIFAIIFAILFIVRISYDARSFADFESYLVFTDLLNYFPNHFSYFYEPLSSVLLILPRRLLQNSDLSVAMSAQILTLLFAVGFYKIGMNQQVSWHGVVLVFAVYGSLLAFVTIRATPAYLLVVALVLSSKRSLLFSVIIVILATLFHISSLLVIAPLAVLNAQRNITYLNRLFGSRKSLIALIALLIILINVVFLFLGNALFQFVGGIASLSKYLTYLSTFSDTNETATLQVADSQIFHYVYATVASAMLIFYIFQKDEYCVSLRGYIITSYLIYIFLFFSPVVAFRQSIFWMIPLILTIPWRSLSFSKILPVPLIMISSAIFIFSFSGVVE